MYGGERGERERELGGRKEIWRELLQPLLLPPPAVAPGALFADSRFLSPLLPPGPPAISRAPRAGWRVPCAALGPPQIAQRWQRSPYRQWEEAELRGAAAAAGLQWVDCVRRGRFILFAAAKPRPAAAA